MKRMKGLVLIYDFGCVLFISVFIINNWLFVFNFFTVWVRFSTVDINSFLKLILIQRQHTNCSFKECFPFIKWGRKKEHLNYDEKMRNENNLFSHFNQRQKLKT